jgi:hypothetical protein
MSSFGANMPPVATGGVHLGMDHHYPNANIYAAPTYTSPVSYAPPPAAYHYHSHSHMGYAPMAYAPVKAAAVGVSSGVALVLFILLVIILRSFI